MANPLQLGLVNYTKGAFITVEGKPADRFFIIRSGNVLLSKEFEIEEELLIPSADWKAIGIDSLDFVDIIVVVENIFGLKIKGEEMADVKTLDDFYTFLETRLN